jgi:hypothetical protein
VIPGETKSAKLIPQKSAVRAINHPVHIFNHECLGLYQSHDTVKLTIKKINRFARLASAPLAVALARVTTDKELRVGETVEICYVTNPDSRVRDIIGVSLASDVPDVICPNDIKPQL